MSEHDVVRLGQQVGIDRLRVLKQRMSPVDLSALTAQLHGYYRIRLRQADAIRNKHTGPNRDAPPTLDDPINRLETEAGRLSGDISRRLNAVPGMPVGLPLWLRFYLTEQAELAADLQPLQTPNEWRDRHVVPTLRLLLTRLEQDSHD